MRDNLEDKTNFKLPEDDKLLIQKHPEVRYTIERHSDGKLTRRTIYGLLRIFSFRINYLSKGGKDNIEDCIRKANIYAIKYTNADYNSQFIKLPENTFLTKEEMCELLKSAGIEDDNIGDTSNTELENLQKSMTKPDGDNNRKYFKIYFVEDEVGISQDVWENGDSENQQFEVGLISTNKDEAIQRAKDYAKYYNLKYTGIFGE